MEDLTRNNLPISQVEGDLDQLSLPCLVFSCSRMHTPALPWLSPGHPERRL